MRKGSRSVRYCLFQAEHVTAQYSKEKGLQSKRDEIKHETTITWGRWKEKVPGEAGYLESPGEDRIWKWEKEKGWGSCCGTDSEKMKEK